MPLITLALLFKFDLNKWEKSGFLECNSILFHDGEGPFYFLVVVGYFNQKFVILNKGYHVSQTVRHIGCRDKPYCIIQIVPITVEHDGIIV